MVTEIRIASLFNPICQPINRQHLDMLLAEPGSSTQLSSLPIWKSHEQSRQAEIDPERTAIEPSLVEDGRLRKK